MQSLVVTSTQKKGNFKLSGKNKSLDGKKYKILNNNKQFLNKLSFMFFKLSSDYSSLV